MMAETFTPDPELNRHYSHVLWASNGADSRAAANAKSLEIRERLPGRLDISYGEGPDEVLDIFPADASGRPVHVFFHGGGWMRGSKDTACFTAEMITEAGGLFVAVNFSKTDKVSLAEITAQSRAAVAWVYQNIARYGGGPERIFVCGKSSGAQQAGMVACTDWSQYGLPDDVVKGGVLVSGSYDLTPMTKTDRRTNVGVDEAVAEALSPAKHIPAKGCPLILAHAQHDAPELHRQAREFAAMWRAAGHESRLLVEENVDHFSMAVPMADKDSYLGQAILTQMGLL